MTTPPPITGSRAIRISPVANACPSSHTATSTAATTMSMKAGFQNTSDAMIAAPSTTPDAMAAGSLRPARLGGATGGEGVAGVREACGDDGSSDSVMSGGLRRSSDLEQLGFLVLEHLVDLVGVLLGDAVETLLRTGYVVLADLAVLLELLERLLGVAADVADRHAAVLGLGLGHLDVVLAALLGQLRQRHADGLAVVGGVHAQVRVPDRLLDGGQRAHVVGRDDDDPRFGGGERRQLLQRRRRTVVVGRQLVEHRRVGPAGADRREVLPRHLDGL